MLDCEKERGPGSNFNADLNAHYVWMVTALWEMLNSGQVQSGTVVRLHGVPLAFGMNHSMAAGLQRGKATQFIERAAPNGVC